MSGFTGSRTLPKPSGIFYHSIEAHPITGFADGTCAQNVPAVVHFTDWLMQLRTRLARAGFSQALKKSPWIE